MRFTATALLATSPDYHLIARRGSGKFDVDFANPATPVFNSYPSVMANTDSGRGFTGTGVANSFPIRVGYGCCPSGDSSSPPPGTVPKDFFQVKNLP